MALAIKEPRGELVPGTNKSKATPGDKKGPPRDKRSGSNGNTGPTTTMRIPKCVMTKEFPKCITIMTW